MSPAPDQPPTPEPNPEPNPERPRGRPTPRGRPRANRVFTNRDRPIAHFDRAHAALAADKHRILGFYGVGGQGKTALRRHLMQRLGTAGDPGHRFGVLDSAPPIPRSSPASCATGSRPSRRRSRSWPAPPPSLGRFSSPC